MKKNEPTLRDALQYGAQAIAREVIDALDGIDADPGAAEYMLNGAIKLLRAADDQPRPERKKARR